MKYVIDGESIRDSAFGDPHTFLYALAVYNGLKYSEIEEANNFLKKIGIFNALNKLTTRGKNLIEKVLVESKLETNKESDIDRIAKNLFWMWPEGFKEVNGRLYPWKESIEQTAEWLKVLIARTDRKFSTFDVIEAAGAYVVYHLHDKTYMKTLRNFILKVVDGKTESELLTWYDNLYSGDLVSNENKTENNE